MTLVRTRDEAIALTDTALGAYAEQAQGILVQAKAAVCAAQDYADRVVRDCRSRAAALEALLSAASERDAPAIRLRLLQAQANLDRAGRASVRIGDAAKTVRDLERRYIQRTSATVAGHAPTSTAEPQRSANTTAAAVSGSAGEPAPTIQAEAMTGLRRRLPPSAWQALTLCPPT